MASDENKGKAPFSNFQELIDSIKEDLDSLSDVDFDQDPDSCGGDGMDFQAVYSNDPTASEINDPDEDNSINSFIENHGFNAAVESAANDIEEHVNLVDDPVTGSDEAIEIVTILIPKEIIRARIAIGELMFDMKFEGTDEVGEISAREACLLWPGVVMQFYGEWIDWEDTTDTCSSHSSTDSYADFSALTSDFSCTVSFDDDIIEIPDEIFNVLF
uniref:Chromo shadow domain-containing protein n=1 Tax=Cuerna arida TaxID=1464854 RepID=A0A1B6ELE7_9HEMI